MRAKSTSGCGAPFPVSTYCRRLKSSTPNRCSPARALVGLGEAPVGEGEHRFAALRPQIEGDARAVPPSRSVGRDGLPADAGWRPELLNPPRVTPLPA